MMALSLTEDVKADGRASYGVLYFKPSLEFMN
jgi:hypothetical protein